MLKDKLQKNDPGTNLLLLRRTNNEKQIQMRSQRVKKQKQEITDTEMLRRISFNGTHCSIEDWILGRISLQKGWLGLEQVTQGCGGVTIPGGIWET